MVEGGEWCKLMDRRGQGKGDKWNVGSGEMLRCCSSGKGILTRLG